MHTYLAEQLPSLASCEFFFKLTSQLTCSISGGSSGRNGSSSIRSSSSYKAVLPRDKMIISSHVSHLPSGSVWCLRLWITETSTSEPPSAQVHLRSCGVNICVFVG